MRSGRRADEKEDLGEKTRRGDSFWLELHLSPC